MGRVRWSLAVLCAAVLIACLGWWAINVCAESAKPTPTSTTASTDPSAAGPSPDGTALDMAHQLEVNGRAPRTDYQRDLFGRGWIDVDRNGCDTRNDVLNRDLTEVTHKDGTRGCVVLTGALQDPYSGQRIGFVRGNKTSNDIQIDHVVALADAWQKGAQSWDEEERIAFANDPLNLLAVSGPLNQQKADGDAATWLPPDKGYRCRYVARQVAVKHEYRLWVTKAEQDAMVRVLAGCPAEPPPR